MRPASPQPIPIFMHPGDRALHDGARRPAGTQKHENVGRTRSPRPALSRPQAGLRAPRGLGARPTFLSDGERHPRTASSPAKRVLLTSRLSGSTINRDPVASAMIFGGQTHGGRGGSQPPQQGAEPSIGPRAEHQACRPLGLKRPTGLVRCVATHCSQSPCGCARTAAFSASADRLGVLGRSG